MQSLQRETYEFQAKPQVVKPKAKYRNVMEEQAQNPLQSNIMYDKRVVRGNTYAATVIQKGQEKAKKDLMKQSQNFKKPTEIFQQSQQPQQQYLHPSTPKVENRENIEVQTDEYIETLADKPAEQESDVQTDFYIDTPPVRLFFPKKYGIDKETQIEDKELFDFDSEVEPILQVLMNKILEQSRMEVLEEEELKVMKQQQKIFEKTRNAELAEMQRLEAVQKRIDQDEQRRKLQYQTVKQQSVMSHKKLISRLLSKNLLKPLRQNTFQIMRDFGVFRNPLETSLFDVYLPWLYNRVTNELQGEDLVQEQFQYLLDDISRDCQLAHAESIQKEKDRKNQIFADRERIKQEKIDAKVKKEEEKQRQIAKEKRDALRDKIFQKVLTKGEIKPLVGDAENPLPEYGK